MTKIEIKRKKNFLDFLRKDCNIIVDNICINKEQTSPQIELSVTPGKHTMYIQTHKSKSNIIDFTIEENETKRFAWGSFLLWFDVMFILFSFGLFTLVFIFYFRDASVWVKQIDGVNNYEGIKEVLSRMPTKLKRKRFGVYFLWFLIHNTVLSIWVFLLGRHTYGILLFLVNIIIVATWYVYDLELKKI